MGGTADSGQMAGQDAPEDLMTVREAAALVGIPVARVTVWGRSGHLHTWPSQGKGQRVSLSAVRALVASPPGRYREVQATAWHSVYKAAQLAGVESYDVRGWIDDGRLRSQRGALGVQVRLSDVQILAHEQRGIQERRSARDAAPLPLDLVTVREAVQAVGVTPPTMHRWIRSGRLTVPPGPGARRVSLAAVHALCAPFDPQTPPAARLVYEVAQAVGMDRERIRGWARRGLLPSWQSRHGLLVREADVRAVAQKQGALPPSDQAGA